MLKTHKEKRADIQTFKTNARKRYSYMANHQNDDKVRERWAKQIFGDRWKEELAKRDAARREKE